MVTDALDPSPLKDTYLELTRAESRHHALFFRLARNYFSDAEIRARADELLDAEAEIVGCLPLRAAVH
jgi:tRNA isopentenyl-2-thiomethyl-A-37 hydroxylase MiaE